MTRQVTQTDVRITANDQNMWATGDAFIVEWGDYVPILGGEMTDFDVISVAQPEIGRVTFEGDELTWDAAGATIAAPRSVTINYRVRDDQGEESDRAVTLDLENTLAGLEVSDGDDDSGIGSLTFDAVPIEDRMQDRAELTLDKFVDFDLDLDVRRDLEESGVLNTLRSARDTAEANLETANASFSQERREATEAANTFADTAETWALTAANNLANAFSTVTSAAVSVVNTVSETAKSGLATTYTDVIETLNGRIAYLQADIDVANGRAAKAAGMYDQLLELYDYAANNDYLTQPMTTALVDGINMLVDRADLGIAGGLSAGATYNDVLSVMNDIFAARTGIVDAEQKLKNLQKGQIELRDKVVEEYNALSALEKVLFQFADIVNSFIEGGFDALTTTVTEIDRVAQGNATEAKAALDRNGSTATIGDVLSDLGDVIVEGAEVTAAGATAFAAESQYFGAQGLVDAATAIGDGNKLKFELEVDAAASAQAGIVIDLHFDGGSVDSNLDYALTSTSTYDVDADTFTILPTATNATTGEEIAFTTISPNAQFFVGLAYFADITLDIATEYFGKAIGFDLFDSNGRDTATEYFSIGGVFDIIDVDTANLSDAGILPDLPLTAFQFPEFNEDNQITIEFGNWVDEVISELSFGIPIIETEGKATEFSRDFYADETNVEENLQKILADFANAQLDFSEDFKTLLEANGSATEFSEADFFEVIEAVFDSITAADEISDDGFIPIIELSVGSDTALFHIDTFANDLSGLDLSSVGSLGFFTSTGTSNEVAKIEIDVDTLATVIVAQILGIPPEESVNFNPLSLGWSLEETLEDKDLTENQKSVINNSVALGVGLDLADLKIGSGWQFDQKFALRIDDMDYQVVFEDGTTQRIAASDAGSLQFANASALQDVNEDGKIDYTMTLTPDAEFFNDTELKLAIGYTLDILKANLELGLTLPLSEIAGLGLDNLEIYDQNLALGPLFRASADLELLTMDIFEDRFAYEAGSAAVAGSFVVHPNNDPTGGVTISGDLRVDQILRTASTLADEDGLGPLSYQWFRGDTAIDGATGRGYRLVEADVGQQISVRVSYTDGRRTVETVTVAVDGVVGPRNFQQGTSLADVLIGRDGNDTLIGLDGNDILRGGADDDNLSGGTGADTLEGGLGEDRLDGGPSADRMVGGQNGDFYIVDNRRDEVIEVAGDVGIDRVASSVSFNISDIDIETLILGGSADTNAIGNAKNNYILGSLGDNEIQGGAGNDRIEAAGGDDTLRGGAGNDTLNGGPGSDVFYVEDVGDRVAESRRWEGEDHVIASVDFRMGSAHIETLQLVGDARLGAGNGLRNTITGTDGDNLLDGGKNVDTLVGGAGNDTYLLRAPGDNAVEREGGGIDTVRAFRTIELDANVENLFIQTLRNAAGEGVPGVNGFGNGLDNTIVGNPFDNFLAGRGGNDSLRGQAGADTFVFDTALGAGNVDTIVDFNLGAGNTGDRLYMHTSVFAGIEKGQLAAELFTQGTTASDADDRFVFDAITGRLSFDADGAGGAAQQLIATFANGAVVEASDIFLV